MAKAALAANRADLVLSGGGVKGIGLVGAMLAAAAHSGQVDSALLKQLAMGIDYPALLDQGPIEWIPLLGPAWGVLSGDGIYLGDALHRWIEAELARFGVTTFADLALDDRSLPVERRYRLVVTVADVTRGELVRLPWDYQRVYGLDPNEQSVADAVRASTAIPFFYRPAKLTSAVKGEPAVESILVDGGLLSNFPIDSLDRTDGQKPKWPTFGITLLPDLPADNEHVIPALRLLHKLRPPTLLEHVITTILVGRDQAYLNQPWVRARAITVDTTDVGVLDFNLSDRAKEALYDHGLAAGREFLTTWDWTDYVTRFR